MFYLLVILFLIAALVFPYVAIAIGVYLCSSTNIKVKGGVEPGIICNNLKTINVITKDEQLIESIKNLNGYNINYYDSYPKYNIPSYITITDIVPKQELPSTYIFLYKKEPVGREIRFDDIKDINDIINITPPPTPKTISMYNTGEHIFTRSPPNNKTFNYDDSYDIWVDDRDTLVKDSAIKGIPFEKYMTACLSSFIEKNSTILDIGTNVGTVSLPLSRLHNCSVKVVSFEPFPNTYSILYRNIIQNKAFNITPLKMLVGDKSRSSVSLSDTVVVPPHHTDKKGTPETVSVSIGDVVHFGAIQIGKGKLKASMTTIDELNLNISAMKVDVEGAEPLVFYGAKNTIKRCMPVIVFEYNEKGVSEDMESALNGSDATGFDILNYCYSLGYRDFYELDIQDYMLVPPNRKQIETNSVAKFKKVKKIKGFKARNFNLFKFVRPTW
jgi:FkbM family methyltransferase